MRGLFLVLALNLGLRAVLATHLASRDETSMGPDPVGHLVDLPPSDIIPGTAFPHAMTLPRPPDDSTSPLSHSALELRLEEEMRDERYTGVCGPNEKQCTRRGSCLPSTVKCCKGGKTYCPGSHYCIDNGKSCCRVGKWCPIYGWEWIKRNAEGSDAVAAHASLHGFAFSLSMDLRLG